MISKEICARPIARAQLKVAIAIFSLWFFASPVCSAGPNSQTVKAYKLSQTHFTLGSLETLCTDDAFRLTLQNGAVLLARAPTWKVVLFLPSRRVAHEISRSDFLASGLSWVQIYGLPPLDYRRRSEKQEQGETVVDLEGSNKSHTYQYRVIEPVKVQYECCELIERAFRVPYRRAIPLQLLGEEPGHDDLRNKGQIAWLLAVNPRRPGGRTSIWRLRTSHWSKVTVPKSEFDYPVGYKLVKTEPEVLLQNSKTQELLQDLFGTDNAETTSAPSKR